VRGLFEGTGHSRKYGNFLHPAVTSSLLGPNILFNILLSVALHLCSSIRMTDQVSNQYKTGKIIDLYILIFTFLEEMENKIFWTDW
jgi:hypothetical protein